MSSGTGCINALGFLWIIMGVGMSRSGEGATGIAFIVFGIAALVYARSQKEQSHDRSYPSTEHTPQSPTTQSSHSTNTSTNSAWEDGIANFVSRICPYDIRRNDRTIIPSRNGSGNLEIDMYIPDLKLGIECNGEHWHDHKQYLADAHQGTELSEEMYKENYCARNGITLIHVWDSQEMNDIQAQIKRAIELRL